MNKLIVSSLVFLLYSTDLFACSCVAMTEMEQIDNAKLLFVARVVAAHEVMSESDDISSYVEAEFELIELMKGNEKEIPETLRGGFGGGDCGIPFVVGHNLLVHTNELGRVNICGGTRHIVGDYDFHVDPLLEKYRLYLTQGEPIIIEPDTSYIDSMKRIYCEDQEQDNS